MPAQSEMIIRGAVDDSANKLTYETDMLVEANETFLKKDKAIKPITPSTVICATNTYITISFVSSSLIRKLPRPIIFNLSPLAVKTS
jgi:hypothetical protein